MENENVDEKGLASRVEELENLLRRYEPDPDFSQKELVHWYHVRMHEVVNRAYRVYCDTKTVFPKGLARWMGVNTEDDFSKVISEREMRKDLGIRVSGLEKQIQERDKLLQRLIAEQGYVQVDMLLTEKRFLKHLADIIDEAEKLLAGAHAEEKPNG